MGDERLFAKATAVIGILLFALGGSLFRKSKKGQTQHGTA